MVIGMPTFGRGFTLKNMYKYKVGDAAVDTSKPLAHTLTPGRSAYYEVRDRVYNNDVNDGGDYDGDDDTDCDNDDGDDDHYINVNNNNNINNI